MPQIRATKEPSCDTALAGGGAESEGTGATALAPGATLDGAINADGA